MRSHIYGKEYLSREDLHVSSHYSCLSDLTAEFAARADIECVKCIQQVVDRRETGRRK